VYSAATLGPERIAKVVTVGIPHLASIRPSPMLVWNARHFLSLPRRGAEKMVRANDFAHVDVLVKRWSPAWNVPPGETDAVKRAFREPGCLNAALGYYRAVGLRPTPSQRARITIPAVSFAGLNDILPPEAYDRAASWFTGGYEVVRMPGGHFMHREHPETFVRELLRVLGPPNALGH
jgi:pimeloyl-ACP methyl ester carboxylesterase